MTAALDQAARTALERFVQRARRLLEDDLAREAEGRFGIHVADGQVEDEGGLHLDPAGVGARQDVVEILDFLRREEPTGAEAAGRLIREAAFTHLNRLVAIRIAEAIQLLPESLAGGSASTGFKELLEVAPLLAHDASGGYWRYLQLCGDELAADLPQLFDPRNPLLELAPSPAAFDDLVEMVGAPDLDNVWDAPDALGWAYQFFNSGDERRAMRDASASPRNSRELAVRNQFFTPRYVVDFLVHNSLGRRLLEADPTSGLEVHLPMLLDPPTAPGDPLALTDVRVLDPACGSGHFLLGAYDVLERAWELQGVSPEDAAPHIVSSLWGIDIDARCAQVAAAAIILRARRYCKAHELPVPNIITARALPDPVEGWDRLLATLPEDRRHLVTAIRDALTLAPVLGPLLKVEELLATEIRAHVAGANDDPMSLFGAAGISNDAFGRAEADVLQVLEHVADSTTSGAAERLFAAEARDAIRFVDAMRQRYDATLTNPPYGLPVDRSEPYLRTEYADTWTDMYAAFVERCRQLLRSSGRVGALTSSSFFTGRKHRDWRGRLSEQSRPVAVVDLGGGILQGAANQTVMWVVPRERRHGSTFFADLTCESRSDLDTIVRGDFKSICRQVDPGLMKNVRNFPFAFHMPDRVVGLWSKGESFEPSVASVRSGCTTFDDFRFVRCWWELSDDSLERGWRVFEKGGEFQPYVAPTRLRLDWTEGGRSILEFAKLKGTEPQVLQSSKYWGQPGIGCPNISSVGFSARLLPSDAVFSARTLAVFPNHDDDRLAILGLLNSAAISELLEVFGRSRTTDNGAVKGLPILKSQVSDRPDLKQAVVAAIDGVLDIECCEEDSPLFVSMRMNEFPTSGSFREYLEQRAGGVASAQAQIDRISDEIFGFEGRVSNGSSDRSELTRDRLLKSPLATSTGWAHASVSYLMGCAFGRWAAAPSFEDLRPKVDDFLADPLPPLPACYCAQYPKSSFPASDVCFALVDEPGRPNDVVARLEGAASAQEARSLENVVSELVKLRQVSDLRTYLRRSFFDDHQKRYTSSKRKAPIYWPLTVPSGQWAVWVYAPRLTRETLYAVAAEALRREGHAGAEIARLERERTDGANGRSMKVVDKALDVERKLAEELRRFREEAERIAGLGWEPDLDDGTVLCAAPLADLFPMWKEPALYRKELRAGKYEWSTVSKWADQL